jgi:hypothetical protein
MNVIGGTERFTSAPAGRGIMLWYKFPGRCPGLVSIAPLARKIDLTSLRL